MEFEPIPLGVVVNVAGTGSEMNGGAVITNEELNIKTGRDYPKCNPKFALLDPTYTYSVSKFQMVSGGFDTLSHIMEIYFSGPDEENVSDDLAEALMRGVIRDLREAIKNPEDYKARSNLMWQATMAENRILKLGKRTDFQCHQMEHQLGAYEELARAGIVSLSDFIKEIGLPTTLRELGIGEEVSLKVIADSCAIAPGSYRKMTQKEILEIFQECY